MPSIQRGSRFHGGTLPTHRRNGWGYADDSNAHGGRQTTARPGTIRGHVARIFIDKDHDHVEGAVCHPIAVASAFGEDCDCGHYDLFHSSLPPSKFRRPSETPERHMRLLAATTLPPMMEPI